MELLQLEYFAKVADLQSVSRAARELHISQSSLSQTLSHLEKELGTQLFDRIGRRIVLNEKGKVFYDGIQMALKELKNTEATVRSMAGYYTGRVTLGVFAAPSVISDCIQDFSEENPYVRFSVSTQLSTRNRFHLSDFDLVVFHQNPMFADFEAVPFLYEDVHVVLPKDHPLAEQPYVSLNDLREESFVSFSVNRDTLEPNLRYCAENLFQPKVKYYTDSTQMRRTFIEMGAAGFAATSSLGDFRGRDNLVAIPVTDAPKDTLCIGWHKAIPLTPAAAAFREYILDYYQLSGTVIS